MVAIVTLYAAFVLLATSNNNNSKPRRSRNFRGTTGAASSTVGGGGGGGGGSTRRRRPGESGGGGASSSQSTTGRSRYGRSGKKRDDSSGDGHSRQESVQLLEAPPLTEIQGGPRPTYFTCRHTYENTLIDELNLLTDSKILLSSPGPGLVRVDDADGHLPWLCDPVYALQTLPECVVVQADSIKGLAWAVSKGLLGDEAGDGNDPRCIKLRTALREASRSTLAVHGVVPGMCKGQKTPVMANRCAKIVDELSDQLKRRYPAARKQRLSDQSDERAAENEDDSGGPEERWILQVLLITPDVAAATLVPCRSTCDLPVTQSYWPDWHLPVGLAKVDIVEYVPSSAYRKLMEALECLRIQPHPSTTRYVVDLGACPGGWTYVLRRLGCRVVAVDRSALDPILMEDPMIKFVKGDAFTFNPQSLDDGGVSPFDNKDDPNKDVWMVSDVIAYPERVAELLERWCGGQWASYMVITMKFQGTEPAFPELQASIDIAKRHGYHCRAKHFFNNKNEVTLMLINQNEMKGKSRGLPPVPLATGQLGTPMYAAILPRAA